MARRLSTPEEFLPAPKSPPLRLELACRCGGISTHEFEYALCKPERDQREPDGWDGILLPRVIECVRCGAVDDYALTSSSYARLRLEAGTDGIARGLAGKGREGSRVIIGVTQMWDGTIARRPSQALAHLCKLVDERPTTCPLPLGHSRCESSV